MHIFSANLLLQLFAFGSTLLVAGMLKPAELGLIRSAQAYATVLVLLCGAGLTAPVLRYCADSNFSDADKKALLGLGLIRTAWFSGFVLLLTLTIDLILFSNQVEVRIYGTYALILPAMATTSLLFVYFQSRQEFRVLARNQVVIKLISLAAVVAATYWWGVLGFIIVTVLAAYIGLWPLIRFTRPVWRAPVDFAMPKNFYNLAFYSVLGMFLSALGQAADFILLGVTGVNKDDVGRYALASVFCMAAGMFVGAIQSVLTPRFTSLLNDHKLFKHTLYRWTKGTLIASVGVAFVVLAVAWVVERFFLPAHYNGFVSLLSILLIKFVLWASYAVGGAALLGAGVIKRGTWIALVTMILAFSTGYPLMKFAGVWGAAWMQVLVACATFVLVWWILRAELRVLQENS